MKKIIFCSLTVALVLLFSSCGNNEAVNSAQNPVNTSAVSITDSNLNTGGVVSGGIEFEYFYRGFTAVGENDDTLDKMLGIKIIETDEDWSDFMGKYCPEIPYYVKHDFSRQCLVAQITTGPKPTYAESFDIQTITVDNDDLDIQGGFNTSTGIYALNSNGHINYFINIVVVNKSDLPSTVNNVYTRSGG